MPKHKKFTTHSKTGKNRSKAARAADELRDELKKRAVVPVKYEPKVKTEKIDPGFAKELGEIAPALLASIQEELDEHDRPWFSVEVLAAPSPNWTDANPDWPDLLRADQERIFADKFSAAAQIGSDHLIKLEPIRNMKVDGLTRRKHFYRLQCTSEEGLLNIMSAPGMNDFRGYRIAYFQERSSLHGVRFQIKLENLPPPFKSYDVAMLTEVLISQNWDPGAIEFIQLGKRITPGEPKKLTGMLEIYVKSESVLAHGCDFALEHAGTSAERLAKPIQFPPPSLILGRNPNPTVVPLLNQGLLKGQYFTASPESPPDSGTSNLLEDRAGDKLHPSDYGKLYLRQIIKPGHCKHCWGPKHEADHCLYNGFCRFCLIKYSEMPDKGFHHCCASFIISTPRPPKDEESSISRKRPREHPPPPQAAYVPSQAHLQRQQLFRAVFEQNQALAQFKGNPKPPGLTE